MVVLIDAKKAFDKIQHLFTIKAFNKLDIEGDFPNPMPYLRKPRASIRPNGDAESLCLRFRTR